MTEAYIYDAVRSPRGKGKKDGSLHEVTSVRMAANALNEIRDRNNLDTALVEDVIMGCATPEGATGGNIARQIAIRAGLPVTVSGVTVNRFCSSGLQTVALAAQRVIAGEADIFVAGGVESISLVQNEANKYMAEDEWLHRHKPEIYWPMLATAENVAKRYNIAREAMDRYGVDSQNKAEKSRSEGKFDDDN